MGKTVFTYTISKKTDREIFDGGYENMITFCGGNTGNVCFVDAMRDQVAPVDSLYWQELKDYEEKDGVFVLPAANWINIYGHELQEIMELVSTNMQVCVAGIGVQLTSELDTPKKLVSHLSEELIKSLRKLSEQSVTIGVRGELTAETLRLLGIFNYRIIGCPSFYEPYRKYKQIFFEEKLDLDRYAFNIARYRGDKIINLSYKRNASWIMQSVYELPGTLYGRKIEERHILKNYPEIEMRSYELTRFIRENAHIFYTRDAWSEYLVHNISFVYGTRFHGNMMAFSNGIPALWIIHDERMSEMVETMHLPYIKYEELSQIDDIEELREICKYDESFKKIYADMGIEYIKFLEENGITHTF